MSRRWAGAGGGRCRAPACLVLVPPGDRGPVPGWRGGAGRPEGAPESWREAGPPLGAPSSLPVISSPGMPLIVG